MSFNNRLTQKSTYDKDVSKITTGNTVQKNMLLIVRC